MKQKLIIADILWIISEACYYLGLVCAVLFIPMLTLVLWLMSLIDKAHPKYWVLLIAWGVSVLMFAIGVALKNWIYSAKR